MVRVIKKDIEAVLNRDPAAGSILEVILCYPGLYAIILYRIAHWVYKKGLKLTARVISTLNRLVTGIDIHPAAIIGEGLFIDHGAGVVIGETTEIGNNVTIYQGATLGGTGKDTGKRHPTIGNNVMISSGAKILGPIRVGDNSKIGAGAVVIKEVPHNSTVVGVPGRIVKRNSNSILQENEVDLDQIRFPDPMQDQFEEMMRIIIALQSKIQQLENKEMDTAV